MTATDRSNNFDLIRLFAAFQVVYLHSRAHMEPPELWPWLHATISMFPGVAIFFLLSGFLISGSYMHSGRGLRGYAKSRALRIYPALWFNLVGLLVMLAATGSLSFQPNTKEFWQWVAVAFPLGSDWIASYYLGPINDGSFFQYFPSGVLWTIPIELSFYVLAPIILARRLRDRGLLGCSLIAWASISLAIHWNWELRSHPHQIGKYLWFFLLGAAAQAYWRHLEPWFRGKAAVWMGAYLVAAWASLLTTGGLYTYSTASFSNVALTVLLACAVFACAHTAPKASTALRGNDISYGLYLWHMPVMWVFVAQGLTGSWLFTAMSTFLAVALAAVSWRLIEKPALALKKYRPGGANPPGLVRAPR